MAVATASSTSVNAPTFADNTTGNLNTSIISVNLAWVIELRCLSNMLNTNPQNELNQMRADELSSLLSPNGAI